jgi:hypothetical protein
MTDQEYLEWSKRYCAIFLKNLAQFVDTLREWRRIFAVESFTATELNAALDAMALHPPETQWDHHRWLLGSVRQARAAKKKADLEAAERRKEEAQKPMTHDEWQTSLAAFRRAIGETGIHVTEPKPCRPSNKN